MNKNIFLIIFILFGFILMNPDNSSKTEVTQDRIDKVKDLLDGENDSSNTNLAPDISLKSSTDSLYVLSDLRDKVVLVNFWATWCGPCRMEIPEFNELYEKYNKSGFEILGVSLSDTKKQLVDFAKTYGVKYPLLYGSKKEIDQISRDYGGIPAVPWSILIGKSGEIVRIYPGAILKDYDPQMFYDLVLNIENNLKVSN